MATTAALKDAVHYGAAVLVQDPAWHHYANNVFIQFYTIAGETYTSAYTATYTSPTGTVVYDYYVHCNSFDHDENPGNIRFAIKAVYHGQSRTITIISKNSFTFFIGRIRQ